VTTLEHLPVGHALTAADEDAVAVWLRKRVDETAER